MQTTSPTGAGSAARWGPLWGARPADWALSEDMQHPTYEAALQRTGLDYESVARFAPQIIYCSLKGYLPGPYENRLALDEVVQMMGGLAYMTGLPDRPMRAGASVNDIMGGMFGVIAIQAALAERQRCLTKLAQMGDIPAEVLMSLPSILVSNGASTDQDEEEHHSGADHGHSVLAEPVHCHPGGGLAVRYSRTPNRFRRRRVFFDPHGRVG